MATRGQTYPRVLVIGPPRTKPVRAGTFPSGVQQGQQGQEEVSVTGGITGPVSVPAPVPAPVQGLGQGQVKAFDYRDWYHPTVLLKSPTVLLKGKGIAEVKTLMTYCMPEIILEPTFRGFVKKMPPPSDPMVNDYGPFNIGHREALKDLRGGDDIPGEWFSDAVDPGIMEGLYGLITGQPLPQPLANGVYPNSDWMAYDSAFYPVADGVPHNDDGDYVAHLVESSYPGGIGFGTDPTNAQRKSRDFIDYLFRLLDRNGLVQSEVYADKVLKRMGINNDLGLGLSRRNELKNVLGQGFVFRPSPSDPNLGAWLDMSDEQRRMLSSYSTAPYNSTYDIRPEDVTDSLPRFGPHEYSANAVFTFANAGLLPTDASVANERTKRFPAYNDDYIMRSWMYKTPIGRVNGIDTPLPMNIYGVRDVLEVYRRTEGGVKSGLSVLVTPVEVTQVCPNYKVPDSGLPLVIDIPGQGRSNCIGVGYDLMNKIFSAGTDLKVKLNIGARVDFPVSVTSLGEFMTMLERVRESYLAEKRKTWGPKQIPAIDQIIDSVNKFLQ